MPFKSAKQRRYLYSQKPEVAKKFAMDSAKKGKILKLKGGGADMGDPGRAQERADRGYGDTSGVDRSAVGPGSKYQKNKNKLNKTTKPPETKKTPERKFYKAPPTIPTIGPGTWAANKVLGWAAPKAYDVNKAKKEKFAKKEGLYRDFYRTEKKPLEVMDPKNKSYMKDAGYGKTKTTNDGGGDGPKLCPNGRPPPCAPTATKANVKVKPKVKTKYAFDDFKAYKKGKMIKVKKASFGAMIKKGGPRIQQAFNTVINRKIKNEQDPVRRNKLMQYGSVPVNELESKVKQMRASNKKTNKPEDKSKTFFGGFKAYAKKGKMISTQSKVNGVITALKKASKLHAGQAKTLSKLKLNKGGGVPYGPPPLRGPNPQVPPVKFSRGGGAAIRGTKFIGVK